VITLDVLIEAVIQDNIQQHYQQDKTYTHSVKYFVLFHFYERELLKASKPYFRALLSSTGAGGYP
jgi:hypothetical protein